MIYFPAMKKIFFIPTPFQLINHCILKTEGGKKKARVKVITQNPILILREVRITLLQNKSPYKYSKLFLSQLEVEFSYSSLLSDDPTSCLRRLVSSLILTSDSLSTQNQPQPLIFLSFITSTYRIHVLINFLKTIQLEHSLPTAGNLENKLFIIKQYSN